MDAENQHQANCDQPNCASSNVNRRLGNGKCPVQTLRVLPLVFVGVGCLVIVFGQMFQSTACTIAGPIIVALGGLLLLLIVLFNPGRRNHKEDTNNNESAVTPCPSDQHTVSSGFSTEPVESRPCFWELRFPLDSCAIEMVPPSYEEAVCSADNALSSSSCLPQQERPEVADVPDSDPPSYQDCVAHTSTGSYINPIALDQTAE